MLSLSLKFFFSPLDIFQSISSLDFTFSLRYILIVVTGISGFETERESNFKL